MASPGRAPAPPMPGEHDHSGVLQQIFGARSVLVGSAFPAPPSSARTYEAVRVWGARANRIKRVEVAPRGTLPPPLSPPRPL